jgi:GGDEF domain-containing protein
MFDPDTDFRKNASPEPTGDAPGPRNLSSLFSLHPSKAPSVLLIGDAQRDVHAALLQAVPGARITSVATVFDGIADLTSGSFTTVLAAIEPIERRPDAAVRTLRELAGDGRIVLFGHPTLEVLARKMLEFGCDDYIITPASADDLQQMFGSQPLRLAPVAAPNAMSESHSAATSGAPDIAPSAELPVPGSEQSREAVSAPVGAAPSAAIAALSALSLAEIFLDALTQTPHDAPAAAVARLHAQLAQAALELHYKKRGEPAPAPPAPNRVLISVVVRAGNDEVGTLHLLAPAESDEPALRNALAQIAQLLGKTAGLQDRHNRLQKLAITDELTGLYNARYFRHVLLRIIERAKAMRFPVTLLLFDIDDFKKYNDQFGHAVGDEILKQTAQLMRRCCREQDVVARIGGDEFAVVFWDKEGPRQPLDPGKPVGPSLPPSTPLQIFDRFKRLAASAEFTGLGSTGRGRLSVSGGLAVYPYDATDAASLIKAADEYLMFHAKKAGKNSVYLVNGEDAVKATEAAGEPDASPLPQPAPKLD